MIWGCNKYEIWTRWVTWTIKVINKVLRTLNPLQTLGNTFYRLCKLVEFPSGLCASILRSFALKQVLNWNSRFQWNLKIMFQTSVAIYMNINTYSSNWAVLPLAYWIIYCSYFLSSTYIWLNLYYSKLSEKNVINF